MTKGEAVYQCVPNFSEGRSRATVEALVCAAQSVPGAQVVDYSLDQDHNRSVVTILASETALHDAVLAMADVAVQRIDLRTHLGEHPRFGAIDVVPIVPIRNTSDILADIAAHKIGKDIASKLHIPIYFYELSAADPARTLPYIRRQLASADTDTVTVTLTPDEGPLLPHHTAGVCVLGARHSLVAYNVDLNTDKIEIAKTIASSIRRHRECGDIAELQGVRALGMFLPSRGRAQVSMNLTDPAASPLKAVWEYVRTQANRLGVDAVESEIIGVIPAVSLGSATPESIHWDSFHPGKIIEDWLRKSGD